MGASVEVAIEAGGVGRGAAGVVSMILLKGGGAIVGRTCPAVIKSAVPGLASPCWDVAACFCCDAARFFSARFFPPIDQKPASAATGPGVM